MHSVNRVARFFLLIVLLLFIPLVACNNALNEIGNSPSPDIVPTGTLLESKPQTHPEAVIVFKRSGGIVGIMEEWQLFSDGTLTKNGEPKDSLTPEQTGQLLSQIEQLGYFGLGSAYLPQNTCCDRFLYELTVTLDDRSHTVKTMDGVETAPQELWDILAIVISLFDQK